MKFCSSGFPDGATRRACIFWRSTSCARRIPWSHAVSIAFPSLLFHPLNLGDENDNPDTDLFPPGASGSTCVNTFKAAGCEDNVWDRGVYLRPGLCSVGLDLAVYASKFVWVIWRNPCPLQVILMIRAWACWGRNKRVGIDLEFGRIPSIIFILRFFGFLRCEPPGPRDPVG